jgi:hypothetical protein
MEKRGYIIDDATKEKIKSGKYQTLNALRKNRYAKLYEQSSAVDVKTGEIFTANEWRKQERRESARKAVATRAYNRRIQVEPEYEPDLDRITEEELDQITDYSVDDEWTEEDERSYRQWQERRREKDIQDRIQAEEIDAGEVIYGQVNDLIKAYPTQGSKFLDKALAKEIAKYGRDAVLQGMANAPEQVIAAAQDILYYEESTDAIHTAFIRFFETIMGTTIEDYAEELGEVMDEMTDYEEP